MRQIELTRYYVDVPLRATLFLLTECKAESGIVVTPFFKKGVTSTSSHKIGTLFASNIRFTDFEISGPIPSPLQIQSDSFTIINPYQESL